MEWSGALMRCDQWRYAKKNLALTVNLMLFRGHYKSLTANPSYRLAWTFLGGALLSIQMMFHGFSLAQALVFFFIVVVAINALCKHIDPRFSSAMISVGALAQSIDMAIGHWPDLWGYKILFDAVSAASILRVLGQLRVAEAGS
jgi:hypothetical protein